MKHMKKLISLMLVLLLVVAMGAPAFAAGETGSITINGVSEGNTYEIYKLLDLESYHTDTGVYSYKVNSVWTGFFTSGAGKDYFTVDSQQYATWKAGEDVDTVANFAKAALAYAKEHGLTAVKSTSNAGDYEKSGDAIKFTGLELGYYLIDSTMGALCGLTTTNPNASINAKNAAPTIDKQVQEDSTGNWGDTNSADIGQIIEFRTTINVHAGAQNYVLHDKMSACLTFQGVTKIEHVVPGTSTHEANLGTDYTVVTTGLGDDCTFEVVFDQSFCDHLETNDKVIVYYSAMLNRNAVVAGEGNLNDAYLKFGEGSHVTNNDITKTYTYGFDLIKTDSQNQLINGAEFRIYDAETGGNEVAVVLMDDGETYRRARADETGVNIVVNGGKVRVVGFDNGTYYLDEVEIPTGYNKLASRQKFIISDSNLDATFNGPIYSTGSGVHVVNKSGTMLPETGGAGTAMLIGFGVVVALGTGILLVTKKRMGMIKD